MTFIRRITDEDELVKLLPIIQEDAAAIGIDWNRVDVDKLWFAIHSCMNSGAVFVAEINDTIVGCNVLIGVESFWCDDITIANLIYYVSKAHRKSDAGIKLLKAAKEFAGNRELTISVHSFDDIERKDNFFKRHGFVKVGGRYQNKESICQVQ